MKFYISSHDKQQARQLASSLVGLGHEVVSRWHDRDEDVANMTPDEKAQRAQDNIADLYRAHALISIAAYSPVPGGKHVELGVAIANMKDAYLIDPALVTGLLKKVEPIRENLGYYHPRVKSVTQWGDLPTAKPAATAYTTSARGCF